MALYCLGPMKAPRAGVWEGWYGPAGSGALAWPQRECLGAPLHQLVHDPETGEATGSCSLAEDSSFFLFKKKKSAQHCIALRVAREVR